MMIAVNVLAFCLLGAFADIARSDVTVTARWCISEMETRKCMAFKNELKKLGPMLNLNVTAECVFAINATECMKKIDEAEADLVTLDGGHILMAGKYHNMVPVVAEDYGGNVGTSYYAVAVVRKNNTGFDINSLKGKKSCHTGAGKNAGWNVPIGFLLKTKKITLDSSCSPYKAAGGFFNESCVPGAGSPKNLCALCDYGRGTSCSSNGPFAGYAGAFECMAKGYGDVAFVKHTTVSEMVYQDPASYGKLSDYEYLCPEGGRKAIGEHKTCNLGRTPSHAVMTRKTNRHISNYTSMLLEMSKKFGVNQTDYKTFQLFNSTTYEGKDLMFKDSTLRLISVGAKNSYDKWLGKPYMDDLMALHKCGNDNRGPGPKGAAAAARSLAILVIPLAFMTFLCV